MYSFYTYTYMGYWIVKVKLIRKNVFVVLFKYFPTHVLTDTDVTNVFVFLM